MTDQEIIEKYIERSEEAIQMTKDKYGALCTSIAKNILRNREDTEECVYDTYFRAWNTIPPVIPEALSPFLSKITRNLALDRFRRKYSEKRGGQKVESAFDELEECLSSQEDLIEQTITSHVDLDRILSQFLASLNPQARQIFIMRYFYMLSVREIAFKYHFGLSKVKMSLSRSRKELKELLEKEGW